MKAMNFMMCETMSHPSYNAPSMEVVEINFEQGFSLSSDSFGLGDGTSYDEEDVDW